MILMDDIEDPMIHFTQSDRIKPPRQSPAVVEAWEGPHTSSIRPSTLYPGSRGRVEE